MAASEEFKKQIRDFQREIIALVRDKGFRSSEFDDRFFAMLSQDGKPASFAAQRIGRLWVYIPRNALQQHCSEGENSYTRAQNRDILQVFKKIYPEQRMIGLVEELLEITDDEIDLVPQDQTQRSGVDSVMHFMAHASGPKWEEAVCPRVSEHIAEAIPKALIQAVIKQQSAAAIERN